MSKPIVIEDILKKHQCLTPAGDIIAWRADAMAAIKEIVEKVVDLCKEEADCYTPGIGIINRDSIEQVKQMIDYE